MSPGPLFTLCVRLAVMVSKLPVFILPLLSRHSVIAFMLSYYIQRSVIIRFLVSSGGGGGGGCVELSLRFFLFLLHGL